MPTDDPDTSSSKPAGSAARRPIRVAVVLESLRGPAWRADVVTSIARSPDTVVVDVVTTDRGGGTRVGLGSRALLGLYDWIDGLAFGRGDDPTRIVALNPSLADGGSTPVRATVAGQPEIVLRLDGREDPLDRWPAPALGVWSLAHSADLRSDPPADALGLDPGGAEMLVGWPFTVSRLVAVVDGERHVVGQVVSKVDTLSLRRGSRGHLRKMPGLVTRALSALRADGVMPGSVAAQSTPSAERASAPRRLGAVQIARGLASLLGGYFVRRRRRRVAPERWVVATSTDGHDPRGGGESFRFLEAPDPDREWADPFPVRTAEADLLFVEEYVRSNHRGRLAVITLDRDEPGGWRSVNTILDLPNHLSYPFVFEWSGRWYLLPEQAATGALQLYVARSFPLDWRFHSTVLDRPAADATLAEIDGRWWLFAAMSVPGGNAADELYLYHAPTPLGPWTAHARNPVVSDVRYARPAGRLRHRDGAWYRVAQDGAISYGHSIAVLRIDRLDPDHYAETLVDRISPDWSPDLIGTHTYNEIDGLTAVDALRLEPRRRPGAS